MKLSTVWLDGLWDRNPGLIQLLGLCPLLAVSNTLENAIGLGLATLFVLVLSNASISLIRTLVDDSIRLPVFVLVIAALTTCAELLVQALDYQLYQSLGIFLPLIVTNCLILGRAEALAKRETVFMSTIDGLAQGLGFFLVLVTLGALREWMSSTLILAALPPGAFIALGLLVALHQWIQGKLKQKPTERSVDQTNRRVRTTGDIS
ncbi:electron transport complex subunit RsxE [Litorivicinus sp.]|jgi:Na+-translocating ferredoxin:NAD+ oxidoreductase subunit E|nr:electron transport complex subunit RsxE [Litorivicinaceae bacterium]MDC0379631.1 electron transport complex subunit RsxE [Litorivicinus sp.]MDG1156200.1 electron transport complex subunit RsxE [Litorivicinaceae bacterium]